MINWQNRILTNVKTELGDRCKNVVATSSNMKAVFPACCVSVISAPSVADDLDIGSEEENAIDCGVEIEIYSKVSLSDAMSLMAVANSAMYKMGFKRRQGANLASYASPDITRVIARYTRVIGADDVIDKFGTTGSTGSTGETGNTGA